MLALIGLSRPPRARGNRVTPRHKQPCAFLGMASAATASLCASFYFLRGELLSETARDTGHRPLPQHLNPGGVAPVVSTD